MEKAKTENWLPIFLILIISLTSSFDIFLNFNIGGFSFRVAQVSSILLIILWIGYVLIKKELKTFIGSLGLLIWTIIMIIFIPNTTFMTRSIGYAFWLLLNTFMIFAMVQFISSLSILNKVLKWYVYSFMFISLFGIFQFGLGIIHITPPFVTQWWTASLPRVNGFSYEPSYYATYLITGWVFMFYLCVEKVNLLGTIRRQYIILLIITLALILSSSRIGITLMVLWLLRYVILLLKYLLKMQLHIRYAKVVAIFLVGIIFASFLFFSNLSHVTFLLNGTGLFGTANHSVGDRSGSLMYTLDVFIKNPIIGVSLGGVAPAIGQLNGVDVVDQNTAKLYEGQTVFAEVLAASGIIGFIPFVIFILSLIIRPLRLIKFLENQNRNIMAGLVYSLIAILIILQLNQNILRVYLWFHIGVLCSAYSLYRSNQGKQS